MSLFSFIFALIAKIGASNLILGSLSKVLGNFRIVSGVQSIISLLTPLYSVLLPLYSMLRSILAVQLSLYSIYQILHIQVPQHQRYSGLVSSRHFVIGLYVMFADRRYRHSQPKAAY